MRILVLGADGYIGTALTPHLQERHELELIDNGLREKNVNEVGSQSITEKDKRNYIELDVSTEYERLKEIMKQFNPDTIVHLAEQPSAPYSMSSAERSAETQRNNVIGTLNVLWAMKEVSPDAHLIKLGTEGEYPDWLWNGKHIPEGNRMVVNGDWEIPTPRYAGSWYHFSKLHDSMNIDYACKIWGLTATDVNQGVVYGHRNGARLDADEYFGTVINRFCAQAVTGQPLTIYGTGGQTRGFINLQNSLESIQLLAENPPNKGDFRVIHQTTKEYSVKSIAEKIQKVTGCEIQHIENPRAEMKENNFTFDTSTLDNLGLRAITLDDELPRLLEVMEKNKENITSNNPTTTWN